jgi:N-acylneuraminate cytidylyltransferase
MRLAVIPARGGSKRIPRKNIKDFFGRPIIAWSIMAARNSGCFDKIIVSTDDKEISEVAILNGAEVPFMRPMELSDDYTPTLPVIRHAVEWLATNNVVPSQVCCIYATAPLISFEDLRLGASLIAQSSYDYVFSIARFSYPIQRALKMHEDGKIEMFDQSNMSVRSQDLIEGFHDAGQFYWGRASAWLAGNQIFGDNSAGVVVPRHRVQDIDNEEDWIMAEILFSRLRINDM